MATLPVLYTFRRCPYAIRARVAIAASGVEVEIREVVLRDKPESMLAYSPKGTVPVLVLAEGEPQQSVIDESRDVMAWALGKHDPLDLGLGQDAESVRLIQNNDGPFKQWLDRYKYSIRFPEETRETYQSRALETIKTLDALLAEHRFLLCDRPRFVDLALFPFIRQFAFVDKAWFDSLDVPHCQRWLHHWLEHSLFKSVMMKYPQWEPGHETTTYRCEVVG